MIIAIHLLVIKLQTVGRKLKRKPLLDREACWWLANEVYSNQILKSSCYNSRSILRCCTNFSLKTNSRQLCCKQTGRRFRSTIKGGRTQITTRWHPLLSSALKFLGQPSMRITIYFYYIIHSSCCKTLGTFFFFLYT